MNIKKFLVGVASGAVMLGAMIASAIAVAPWNVTGNYEVTFFLDPDTSITPYVHHATLSQTGSAVTGDGGYPATGGDTFHWNVTSGTQTGDSLNLTVVYDLGAVGTTMHMVGTIAANGTVSGTWDDDLGGTRTGTWSITKGVSVPLIHTPANGATVATSALVKIDWTDSVGSNPPFQYQYQAFSDSAYTALVYDSGMTLSASEIPTPGTPPGDYYVRVMAQNSVATQSDWSNGSGNPYVIHVTADPVVTLTPTPSPAPVKVNVCHLEKKTSNKYHLISVDQAAVPAHLKHGDVLAPSGVNVSEDCTTASFSASDSLYYNGPTNAAPLYGTGPISFTWNISTGVVTGGLYEEIVPPTTGTHYFNEVTSGSVVGGVVNLTFTRTLPGPYGPFYFVGTLVGNVLTGQLDGPYLFTATGI